MGRLTFVFLFCLGLLGLAGCGQSTATRSAAAASACMRAPRISQTADTSGYKMVLDVGPREVMYTLAEARAKHPTHGEVMLRGQMSNLGNMGNMGTSASARHLEVHICNRSIGQVAANLQPAITLVDNSAADMTADVPTAVMQGTTSRQKDVHYGNNVIMPPGRHFAVTVAVGDQHATFHVATRPAS